MDSNESISKALKEISDSFWNENKQPLLLSNLPSKLITILPDYKSLLEGASLKTFIKKTQPAAGYRLIEHPVHRAKVAIAPADSAFEFSVDPSEGSSHEIKAQDRNAEKILLAFLRELKNIPDELLEKVHLPVSVIVKFLK